MLILWRKKVDKSLLELEQSDDASAGMGCIDDGDLVAQANGRFDSPL
jgi:hypothetical protein